MSDLSVSCSCSASSCGTSSFSSSSSSGWSVLGSCCCFCHCCDCLTCEGTGRLIREKTYSRVSCPSCGGSGKRRSFPFRYTPSPYPSDPYVWPKAEPIRFWTTTGAQTRGWS